MKQRESMKLVSEIPSIKTQLDNNIQQTTQNSNDIVQVKNDYAKKTDVNVLSVNKADKTEVVALDTKVNSVASGSPKNVFSTLALLQSDVTANTTEGKKYTYLISADGGWYYWNGSTWTKGGTYQATGLSDNSVSRQKLTINLSDMFIATPVNLPISWSKGGIGIDGNNFDATTNRARIPLIDLQKGYEINCNNANIQFMVYEYDSNGVFIKQLITSWEVAVPKFAILNNNKYRMQTRFIDNRDINSSELSAISSAISITGGESLNLDGTKIASKSISVNSIDDDFKSKLGNSDINNAILSKRVPISDVVAMTTASAGHTVLDESRGMCYTSYLASRNAYGESRHVIGLSVYPINQPFRAEHYVVAEANVPVSNLNFETVYEPNILLLDDRVRVYFVPGVVTNDTNKSNCYMYRDFMKTTKQFSEVGQVLLSDGKALNKANVSTFISAKGGTVDTGTHPIINTCRFIKYNNKIYGALTSANQSPVVFESVDGITYTLKGIIPNPANYECQLEIISDKMYCILRNRTVNNFFVSSDFGVTFNNGVRLEFSDTRPQIIKYGDKLLITHSTLDSTVNENSYVQGRCNARFLLGIGDNPNLYENKLTLKSKYGVVYYSLINNRGDIYMSFSNGELYFDSTVNYGMKDVQQFCKVGKFEFGKDFQITT